MFCIPRFWDSIPFRGNLNSQCTMLSYVNSIYLNILRECWICEISNSWISAKIKFSQIIVNLQYLMESSIWAAAQQNQKKCVPSKDSDQPSQPRCPISLRCALTEEALGPWLFLEHKRILWSDWADAQADLSLRWTHMSFTCSWLCQVATHFYFV